MDRAAAQARIDAVEWYHDFDFPGGLSARARTPDAQQHRRTWAFIEGELAKVDFRGKSVLDIGCWDGYWSFHAEKAGAKSVLASDDATQNWAGSKGLLLAKELLDSRVETRLDVSVYGLASLGRTFDVVLCLGVYYHLLDPFYALAQIRHCCHPGTVVVFEGNEAVGLSPGLVLADLRLPGSKYTPTAAALEHLFEATYFTARSKAVLPRLTEDEAAPGRLGWRWRAAMAVEALRGRRSGMKRLAEQAWQPSRGWIQRALWVCRPFQGANDIHAYRPPFGLHAYDNRWGCAAPERAGHVAASGGILPRSGGLVMLMDGLLVAAGFTGALTLVWLARQVAALATTGPSVTAHFGPEAAAALEAAIGKARRELLVLGSPPAVVLDALAAAQKRKAAVDLLLDPAVNATPYAAANLQPRPASRPVPGLLLVVDDRAVVFAAAGQTVVATGHPELGQACRQQFAAHHPVAQAPAPPPPQPAAPAPQPAPAPKAAAAPQPAPKPAPTPQHSSPVDDLLAAVARGTTAAVADDEEEDEASPPVTRATAELFARLRREAAQSGQDDSDEKAA